MEKNIQIEGLTEMQMRIAHVLWACETKAQVDAACLLLGHDAIVVREMMVAATLDTVNDTDIAKMVLDRFCD